MEKLLKQMSGPEIYIKTRAAKTLYNVGWLIEDIAEALGMMDSEIKKLIKISHI